MAKQVYPKAIVPQKGVRNALGIAHNGTTDQAENNQSQAITESQPSQSQPSTQTNQSGALTQPASNQSEAPVQPMSSQAESVDLTEEKSVPESVEEGKDQSVGKDSMDQDLDAVLDELELQGGDGASEGGAGGNVVNEPMDQN